MHTLYNGILFSHKEENFAICSNINETWKFFMLSGVSQTEKDKYYMILCDLT